MQSSYMKILVKNHKKLEYLRETIIVIGVLGSHLSFYKPCDQYVLRSSRLK